MSIIRHPVRATHLVAQRLLEGGAPAPRARRRPRLGAHHPDDRRPGHRAVGRREGPARRDVPERPVVGEGLTEPDAVRAGRARVPPSLTSRWCRCWSSCCSSRCFSSVSALHTRNTLISCASEGARLGARADAVAGQGVSRTQSLISASLSPRFARNVTGRETVVAGVRVVEVRVVAPMPVLGPARPRRPARRRGPSVPGEPVSPGADGVARDERGSAVVEFVVLAVLMLIPLVYLVMMLARVQAGSYAVSQAAREAGRAFVTAEAGDHAAATGPGRGTDRLPGPLASRTSGRLAIACDGTPCLRPDGRVETTATVRVPLPLVPAFVRDVVPLSVPVSASHLSTVDRFRGLP